MHKWTRDVEVTIIFPLFFCSISLNLAKRVGETIGADIAVREETRVIHKKRKQKIKKFTAFDSVQQKQQQVAKIGNKKEEYEAVRNRIREQYLEKKVWKVLELFFLTL